MQQSVRRLSRVEEEVEAPPQLPLTDGRYFACRRCRRVLSEMQWLSTGCVDCSATMGVPDRDNLLDFATPHFHNFIGLIAPGQSWVARLIMKSRAELNGVFAETLSDDEADDEGEEGEEAYMADEEEPEGYVGDREHSITSAGPVTSASGAEPVAESTAHIDDAAAAAEEEGGEDAQPEKKRVKLETNTITSSYAPEAPHDVNDA